jgi:hypothetical protein
MILEVQYMTIKISYLPLAAQIKKEVSDAVAALEAKLSQPDDMLSATEMMPLAQAIVDLTELGSKVEAATILFNHRIEAYEAALTSGSTNPMSDFATQLDQRVRATSELLRATLDRLDQIERAVIRLYKPPFLEIDPNDKPRKRIAALRAAFDLRCSASEKVAP